jgi:hypothetical protein
MTAPAPSPRCAGSCRSGAPTAPWKSTTGRATWRRRSRSTTGGPGGRADTTWTWYCSGNSEAHVGRDPVYRSCRERIGRADGRSRPTTSWSVRCTAYLRSVRAARQSRDSGGALLPLLVHPATLEAAGHSRRRQTLQPCRPCDRARPASRGRDRRARVRCSVPTSGARRRPTRSQNLALSTGPASSTPPLLRLAERSDWRGATVLELGCGTGIPPAAPGRDRAQGRGGRAACAAGCRWRARRTAGMLSGPRSTAAVTVVVAGAQDDRPRSGASIDVAHRPVGLLLRAGVRAGAGRVSRADPAPGRRWRSSSTTTPPGRPSGRGSAAPWPDYDASAVDRFWATAGVAARIPRLSTWAFDSREDFEAVLRWEFPPAVCRRASSPAAGAHRRSTTRCCCAGDVTDPAAKLGYAVAAHLCRWPGLA